MSRRQKKMSIPIGRISGVSIEPASRQADSIINDASLNDNQT